MTDSGHDGGSVSRPPGDPPASAHDPLPPPGAFPLPPAAFAGAACKSTAPSGAWPCVLPRVPLFPLLNVVLLPGAILPLHIFEQRYRAMSADALGLKCSRTCAGPMDGRKLICMCRIKPGHDPMDDLPPVFDVACVGQIVHHEKLADGRYNLLLQGLCRVRLGCELPLGEAHDRKPYRRADLHPIASQKAFEIDVADARQKMKSLCSRPPIEGTPVGKQLARLFSSEVPTVQLADVLAFDVIEDVEERQRLLEETDERRRVERLVSLLEKQFPDPASILAQGNRFEMNA